MPEHKTLSPSQLNDALCAPITAEAEPLKPPEFTRDAMGRFERPGATLKKDQKSIRGRFQKGQAPGPGRPPGSLNKTTLKLKEAILSALAKVGGDDYLARLAIENSSAFAGLL